MSTLSLRGCHSDVPVPYVSHASALEVYGITDVIPTEVHLSVSRAKRGIRPRAGVRVHAVERPLSAPEVREAAGIDVTTPERALVDALEEGTQPEQIELGIRHAVDRGLTTPRRLRDAAADRSARVRVALENAVAQKPG